jgi:hypothetical protein
MNELVKASPAALTVMDGTTLAAVPEDNTAEMVSSLQRLGLSVSVRHRAIFPTDPKTGEPSGWRDVVSGAQVIPSAGTNLGECMRTIAEVMAPAPRKRILGWLAEVSTITARRNTDEAESTLTLEAYCSRLLQYPGDIVRDTLLGWSGKWFPTWGELKEILDGRTAPRVAIQGALAALEPKPIETPDFIANDPAKRRERISYLKWSAERIGIGRPFPEHRQRVQTEGKNAVLRDIEEEIGELELREDGNA